MASIKLILSDFILSFSWVFSGALQKILITNILGLRSSLQDEILKILISIIRLFIFAWWGKISKGGTYNPLNLLSSAISGSFSGFLFAFGVRIPVQVIGSVVAVKIIKLNFPEIGHGPRLLVDIHQGALAEGLVTFGIVSLSLCLSNTKNTGFFLKTWMTSVSKLVLHMLAADFTGGCMNPAAAMGWAYERGEHITKDHLIVYWLAPIEASLISSWTFRLLFKPKKEEVKAKSD
ncbi:MIP aquaporin [Ranunculus cassubicifolius]